MYFNLLRTMFSLKKRHDYPMYSMTYYGDYGFDEFITQGATNDEDLLQFIQARLTRRKRIGINTPNSGCTTFTARDSNGDILYGRNYDFPATPSLVVKTNPKSGYASISVVDLMALGFSPKNLPEGKMSKKLPLLASPYLPFDGMNEKGLAIAILQVPKSDLPNDPGKITLNTTATLRLLLDKAATVSEAIELLGKYNIYFSYNVYCHYFIADASGKSVIVEYHNNKMNVTEENTASNFYACNTKLALDDPGEVPTPHERYDMVKEKLLQQSGVLSMSEAGKLLCDLGIYDDTKNILQWSVVYNLSALTGMVFPGRDMSKPYLFRV